MCPFIRLNIVLYCMLAHFHKEEFVLIMRYNNIFVSIFLIHMKRIFKRLTKKQKKLYFFHYIHHNKYFLPYSQDNVQGLEDSATVIQLT